MAMLFQNKHKAKRTQQLTLVAAMKENNSLLAVIFRADNFDYSTIFSFMSETSINQEKLSFFGDIMVNFAKKYSQEVSDNIFRYCRLC